MVNLLWFNLPRYACSLASNFDARYEAHRRRLHGARLSVDARGRRSVEVVAAIGRVERPIVDESWIWVRRKESARGVRRKVISDRVRLGVEIATDVRRPNITGTMPSWVWVFSSRDPTGAFSKGESYYQQIEVGNASNWDAEAHEFHANLSSATYGASSTVQPASVRLLPCIKI